MGNGQAWLGKDAVCELSQGHGGELALCRPEALCPDTVYAQDARTPESIQAQRLVLLKKRPWQPSPWSAVLCTGRSVPVRFPSQNLVFRKSILLICFWLPWVFTAARALLWLL